MEDVNIRKKNPRESWEEQFLNAKSLLDDEILLPEFSNDFDLKEWTWD